MLSKEIPHEHVDLDDVDIMPELTHILELAVSYHNHLCPRQVLGARIGLAGGKALGFDLPRKDKKMLVLVETDGCFVSGVQAATGCNVNRRTLRIVDYGMIAVTFVNVKTEEAVRIYPKADIREKAWRYADPDQKRRYFIMLEGYQRMPDKELLEIQKVHLSPSVKTLISRPGVRTNCVRCGEEIINEREVIIDGEPYCIRCAGGGYFKLLED